MFETLTGQSPTLFVGLTLVLFGGAAWMMGRAIAESWRPTWQIWPYGFLLGAFDRFLSFALFDRPLLHLVGFLACALVLVGIGFLGFRVARAGQMVRQYPWLYERSGPLAYREVGAGRA